MHLKEAIAKNKLKEFASEHGKHYPEEVKDRRTAEHVRWVAIERHETLFKKRATKPNKSRGCVKSADAKFGNDPIFNMRNFDESRRWIGWSKDEFSYSLSPEPLALAVPLSRAYSPVGPHTFTGFTSRVGGGSLDR